MEMFLWLIAAYGMSNILVYGSIFEGFRNNFHVVCILYTSSFLEISAFASISAFVQSENPFVHAWCSAD